MTLYCPRCESASPGTICPRCNGRLITPGEAQAVAFDPSLDDSRPIAPTAAGRFAVGTLAALGLGVAAQDWLAAAGAVLAPLQGVSAEAWRAGPAGLVAGHAGGVVAAAFGGLLAGAGRPSGVPTGMAVGATVAGLGLALAAAAGRPADGPALAAAAVTMVAAVVAAVVGARVWPALAELPAPPPGPRASSLGSSMALAQAVGLDAGADDTQGPGTSWVRIGLATLLAAAAVLYAGQAREELRNTFGSRLKLGNAGQAPEVSLQIAVLGLALAGVAAGAGTGAGLRHGAVAGGIAAGLVLIVSRRDGTPPALEGWLKLLELSPDPFDGASLAATAGGIVALMMMMGEAGSQMIWPASERRRVGKSRISQV